MPFDSTKPGNGSLISSVELREQFTSLKTLIDDLTVRVSALEPPGPETHIAVDFGDPNACGTYIANGEYNGKPIFVNPASGYALIWNMTNMWQIATADPRTSMWTTPYTRIDASVFGPYAATGGMLPAGTVS